MQKKLRIVFEPPFKTGKCLLSGEFIPYIITKDRRGVCFWSKDGGIATLGNTCSDFEEVIEDTKHKVLDSRKTSKKILDNGIKNIVSL